MRRLSELHAAESIFHTNFTAKKIDDLIELVPRSLGTRVPKSFRGSECELSKDLIKKGMKVSRAGNAVEKNFGPIN